MQKKPIILIADPESLRMYKSVFSAEELVMEYNDLRIQDRVGDGDADMIILDSGFTPEQGLMLLKDIKRLKPHAPVIFLTDVSSESIAIRAFRSGAIEYFRKPVSLFSFKETATNLLATKRGEHEKRKRAPRLMRDEKDATITTELPSGIFQVICHIDNNLAAPISLEELADRANLSKFHFCRIFKKHTGQTPKKYVLQRRIERAKILLGRNGDLNVSMVASEVGFGDVNSFIKAFKKIAGTTPYAYKKSLRQPDTSMPRSNRA